MPSAAPPWPCCGFTFRGCPWAGCWQGFSSLGEEQEEPFLGTRLAAHPCPAVCAAEPLPCPAVSDVPGQGLGARGSAESTRCLLRCPLPAPAAPAPSAAAAGNFGVQVRGRAGVTPGRICHSALTLGSARGRRQEECQPSAQPWGQTDKAVAPLLLKADLRRVTGCKTEGQQHAVTSPTSVPTDTVVAWSPGPGQPRLSTGLAQ